MDWSKITPEYAQKIVEEGKAYLNAQLTLATSADQRASVMASIFTAAGAAIVAGLITLASSSAAGSFFAVYVGGGVSAALFLAGAGLCVWAVFPVGFYLPGTQPENWESDLTHKIKLDAALGEYAGTIQEKIDDNRGTLQKNAKKFTWGASLGIAAPPVGFIVWLIAS